MRIKTISGIIIALAFVVSACSATKVVKSEAQSLQYKFPTEKNLQYRNLITATQTLDFNGQIVESVASEVTAYTMKLLSSEAGINKIEVTLDTLKRSQTGMMGSVNPDLSSLFGKSFKMTFSSMGEESDFEGTSAISYKVEGNETINLESTFTLLFPDVDGKPVKVGYTWTENDTANIVSATEKTTMVSTTINTVKETRVVNGRDCLVISYTQKGYRKSTMSSPQGEVYVIGDITGTGEFCFSPSEGILVDDVVNATFKGQVEVMGGVFPISMAMKIENRLK